VRLRMVTYNIHKCRGMDRRIRPDRILAVLNAIGADVIALQEVLSRPGGPPEIDQAGYFARHLGMQLAMGENRRLLGAAYGNAVLSRFPLHSSFNYDLSVGGRENRGCFRTEVLYSPACRLQVFNVHLGTGFFERRRQAQILLRQLSANKGTHTPRVILGDFNEWTKGLTSRLLAGHLRAADVRSHLNWRRTYPGLFPVLYLDHVYYDPALHLESLKLDRSAPALLASDHLPLIANFQIAGPPVAKC
jgi:endonuclease/exonuclease/phosphatase family metal-dependent hydrolase